MLICIGCQELENSIKTNHTYASKTTMFTVFETFTRECKIVRYEEMFANLHSGKVKVENLEVKDNNIKGKGIDIVHFYEQSSDGSSVGIVFNKVKHISGGLYGYDIVRQNGNIDFASPDMLEKMLKSGQKIINVAYTNNGVRLISLSGVGERTFKGISDSGIATDFDINTTLNRAIQLFKKEGFTCGYTKNYKVKHTGREYNEAIMICYRNSSVIWFRTDTEDKSNRMVSVHGEGRLIAQGKNKNSKKYDDTYLSKYTQELNDYISTEIPFAIKKIKEFESKYEPVKYFVDKLGEIPEEFAITTGDIESQEAILRDKYFDQIDDIGKGYIYYLFILSEYRKFDKALKALYKHLYMYAKQMLQEKISKDIITLENSQAKEIIKKYLAELMKSFPNIDFTYK